MLASEQLVLFDLRMLANNLVDWEVEVLSIHDLGLEEHILRFRARHSVHQHEFLLRLWCLKGIHTVRSDACSRRGTGMHSDISIFEVNLHDKGIALRLFLL